MKANNKLVLWVVVGGFIIGFLLFVFYQYGSNVSGLYLLLLILFILFLGAIFYIAVNLLGKASHRYNFDYAMKRCTKIWSAMTDNTERLSNTAELIGGKQRDENTGHTFAAFKFKRIDGRGIGTHILIIYCFDDDDIWYIKEKPSTSDLVNPFATFVPFKAKERTEERKGKKYHVPVHLDDDENEKISDLGKEEGKK